MNDRMTIMIALLAVVMMTAPIASAVVVTDFNVTANATEAGATTEYIVQINTTGFHSLNMTIPAGFEAVVPEAGQLVARVDMWSIDPADYANVTFTANSTAPSTKVDVCANVAGDVDSPYTYPAMSVDYAAGGVTGMSKGVYMVNLTLPTAEANGTLNISVDGDGITNMTVMLYLVKNPADAGTYTFVANETNSSAVTIGLPKNGDINGDDVLDYKDGPFLVKHELDIPTFETICAGGDINNDGVLDYKDGPFLVKHELDIPTFESIY